MVIIIAIIAIIIVIVIIIITGPDGMPSLCTALSVGGDEKGAHLKFPQNQCGKAAVMIPTVSPKARRDSAAPPAVNNTIRRHGQSNTTQPVVAGRTAA